MTAKNLTALALAIVAAFATPGLARAGNETRQDRRDSKGALDIASVSHSHGAGTLVTHRLRTYRPFSGRVLKGDNAVAFVFDMNEDAKPDRIALAFWSQGKLRGVLADARGRPLTQVRVTKPDGRTLAVTMHEAYVGGRVEGRYRWLGLTTYRHRKGCPKTCTDVAPNRGLIFHRLWEVGTLSATVVGPGRVQTVGLGLDCTAGTCSARYRKGTEVSLVATPVDGAVFRGWGGACTGTDRCVVRVDSVTSVTATFVPMQQLTVSNTSHGAVNVSPPGWTCFGMGPCTVQLPRGTTVTLTAVLGANQVFDGWSGDCSGTNLVCTLTMDGNRSVTAHVRTVPTTLSVPTQSAPRRPAGEAPSVYAAQDVQLYAADSGGAGRAQGRLVDRVRPLSLSPAGEAAEAGLTYSIAKVTVTLAWISCTPFSIGTVDAAASTARKLSA